MDYYQGSSSATPRGRSSYRGSSYRGSSRGESYRGSRGSSRGYSSFTPRGRGGSTYYPKYESSSPKYSSDASKYASSSYSRYEDFYRRPESSYSSREHRTELSDLASRKRERSDSYSTSQGTTSRRQHDEDDYRSSRYSGGSYPETRSFDDSRSFKKPRTTEYKPVPEYRPKEPVRPRGPRGRIGMRGTFSRRARGDSFGVRRRGTFVNRMTTTATTSEILAIRRAKLLQNRLKEANSVSASTDGKEKTEKKEEGEVGVTVKTEKTDGAEAVEKVVTEQVPKEERPRTNYYGRPFMKLQCPSCAVKCVTFKEYITHLHSSLHVKAIKEKNESLKATLASMRLTQREKQKIADEEDLTSMNTGTLFCAICKLNYSQEKETHNATELHKELKAFLMPNCKTCRIQFESPMIYENHLCSLEHLRRVHDHEERDKKSTGSGVLDNFMVLDSVGSGDEVEEKDEDKTKVAEEKEEDLLLGLEFIRDVRGKYCEVCRTFLTRAKDSERVLKRHCRTKEHLRCYLHFGNELLLEKMKADEDVLEKKPAEKDGDGKEVEGEDPLDGDKLWDGLNELLDEAKPRVKSDDEDEEEGGRFDRFKSKEKKENGDISGEAAIGVGAASATEVAPSAQVTDPVAGQA